MSASDSTEGPSNVKRKSTTQKPAKPRRPKPAKGQFSIDPRLLYSHDEAIANLGVSRSTFGEWNEQGLKPITPMEKRKWYLGSMIIDFMAGQSQRREEKQ